MKVDGLTSDFKRSEDDSNSKDGSIITEQEGESDPSKTHQAQDNMDAR